MRNPLTVNSTVEGKRKWKGNSFIEKKTKIEL